MWSEVGSKMDKNMSKNSIRWQTLYNPWVMGYMYHCMIHGPWGMYTVVWPMTHGVLIPTQPLYNPWPVGYAYCCTIHDPWSMGYPCYLSHCMVMTHGVNVPLYNPWGMGIIYPRFGQSYDPWYMAQHHPYTYCTIHHPWTTDFPSIMGCRAFSSSMGHGSYRALYSDVWTMTHGEKVAEGAHMEKCMDSKGHAWESFQFVLVIESTFCESMHTCWSWCDGTHFLYFCTHLMKPVQISDSSLSESWYWRQRFVRVLCLYPINPSRLSSRCCTSANRCTPTLPR